MKKLFLLFAMPVTSMLFSHAALAEIKIIDADSAYLMGDNDSKVDARRIAVQEAKRKALELAGSYVESLTVVKNHQLTKDEVKAYTAGILETEVVSEQMRGTTERPEISIKARCKIDTDILTAQIGRYRENELLEEQFAAASRENEELKKQRDLLVKQLSLEKDKAKAEVTRTKLDAVLTKEESNDDTTRIWAGLAPALEAGNGAGREIGQEDLDKSALVLERVVKTDPRNQRARHLLASVYQRKGDYAAAEQELRAAIQLHPSNPAPHLTLGLLLKERGRHQEALREFHFVERVRPRNLPVVFHAGMTFKDLGKCARAVQYFNRFLKDRRSVQYPRMREQALVIVGECGGDRPGRQRRARQL
jgi:predicted Zn-dependent protease